MTCIITGAPGENPDDCTTHDHETRLTRSGDRPTLRPAFEAARLRADLGGHSYGRMDRPPYYRTTR